MWEWQIGAPKARHLIENVLQVELDPMPGEQFQEFFLIISSPMVLVLIANIFNHGFFLRFTYGDLH